MTDRYRPIRQHVLAIGLAALMMCSSGCNDNGSSPSPEASDTAKPSVSCESLSLESISRDAEIQFEDAVELRDADQQFAGCQVVSSALGAAVTAEVRTEDGPLKSKINDTQTAGAKRQPVIIASNKGLVAIRGNNDATFGTLATYVNGTLLRASTMSFGTTRHSARKVRRAVIAVAEGMIAADLVHD